MYKSLTPQLRPSVLAADRSSRAKKPFITSMKLNIEKCVGATSKTVLTCTVMLDCWRQDIADRLLICIPVWQVG